MAILDRAGSTRRIRIDASQLTDELAKLVAERDQVDLGKARDTAGIAVGEAAERARQSLERAAERARGLRGDLARSGDRIQADLPLEEIGQRLRAAASPTAIRALVARLERELPDTDKDRYDRAYARGRVQARSIYLALGIAAGVAAGIAVAALLDPRHGKERRDRLTRRTSELTEGLTARAASPARVAQERARSLAQERGLAEAEVEVPLASASDEPRVEDAAVPAEPESAAADLPPVTLPEGAVPVMGEPAATAAEADATTPAADPAAPSDRA